MRASPLLAISDVSKRYRLGATDVVALRSVHLTVPAGQIAAVVGPSGSGKTSLLNLVGAMDVPSAGSIKIDGVETTTLGDAGLTALRRERLGFVFQGFNLVPVLSVAQNVEVPLLLQGRLSGRARAMQVEQMLSRVGLDGYGPRRPTELSGGQRQRVAIARALVGSPRLVLADEPTANLDHETGADILAHLKSLSVELGVTVIISTHDPRVLSYVDRIISLADGVVVSDAPARADGQP